MGGREPSHKEVCLPSDLGACTTAGEERTGGQWERVDCTYQGLCAGTSTTGVLYLILDVSLYTIQGHLVCARSPQPCPECMVCPCWMDEGVRRRVSYVLWLQSDTPSLCL